MRPPAAPRGLVATALAIALGAALLWWRRAFTTVEVAGDSMSPALLPGDYLLVRRGPPPDGDAFGCIASFRDGGGRLLLKRVIGLPGESLRAGEAVFVNGRRLLEPYARGASPPDAYRGVGRLGAGEFFLLGDRRDASTDSRDFGPVSRSRIRGVAWFRYWPPGRIGPLRRPRRRFLAGEGVATPSRNRGNP